jgi:hypothetical protein
MVCVDTSNSCLSTIESRELQKDGLKMTLVHTIPRHPDIRSVRVYKKVTMGIMGTTPTLGLYRMEGGINTWWKTTIPWRLNWNLELTRKTYRGSNWKLIAPSSSPT